MGFISDLFSPESSSETTVNMPSWIDDYIQGGVGNVAGFSPDSFYQGNWQAALNPMLSGAWNNMYNNEQGNQFMGQMADAGSMGLNAMGQGMDYMSQLQNGGAPQFQYNQGVYDQTMSNLAPGMQATFDKGAMDIQKGLDWNVLPGLNMEAAMSGQQGGTRLGQSTALAQSQADQNKMQFGLDLWGNASSQAHNAAMNSGQMNLNAGMNTQQGLLNGYGNYANMGIGSLNNAFNMNQGMFNNQLLAGQGQQGYDQQAIDMMRQQMMFPYEFYKDQGNYFNNVGQMYAGQNTSGSYNPGLGNVGLDFAGSLASGGFFNKK